MKASNVTTEDQVYAGVFGCIMVIGLPLNIVSLWILLRRHSLKSPNSVFMVNLAMSDLLLVFTLPLRVYFHATGKWIFGTWLCLFITLFFRTNLRSSATFITFISVDRLLAVVYPLRSRHLRTSANAWKGVVLIWGILLVMNIPEGVALFKQLSNHSAYNQSKCFESYDANECPLEGTRLGVYLFQIVTLVTMLSINILCTFMVFRALRRHFSGDSAKVKNKTNVMLIFAINMVLYAVFLPVPISMTTNCAYVMPLVCVTVLNCCLDPVLYYFSFDSFWKKKEDDDVKVKGGYKRGRTNL